jgi:hypothetical protein
MAVNNINEKNKGKAMGLSASQAKLLTITARLADNELRAQFITNSKVRLADESNAASSEYMKALDSTNFMYNYYDANGEKNFLKLTAGTVNEYSSLKNQYGLINRYGQIMVGSEDIRNYEDTTVTTLADFLAKYDVELTDNPKYTLALEDLYGINGMRYHNGEAVSNNQFYNTVNSKMTNVFSSTFGNYNPPIVTKNAEGVWAANPAILTQADTAYNTAFSAYGSALNAASLAYKSAATSHANTYLGRSNFTVQQNIDDYNSAMGGARTTYNGAVAQAVTNLNTALAAIGAPALNTQVQALKTNMNVALNNTTTPAGLNNQYAGVQSFAGNWLEQMGQITGVADGVLSASSSGGALVLPATGINVGSVQNLQPAMPLASLDDAEAFELINNFELEMSKSGINIDLMGTKSPTSTVRDWAIGLAALLVVPQGGEMVSVSKVSGQHNFQPRSTDGWNGSFVIKGGSNNFGYYNFQFTTEQIAAGEVLGKYLYNLDTTMNSRQIPNTNGPGDTNLVPDKGNLTAYLSMLAIYGEALALPGQVNGTQNADTSHVNSTGGSSSVLQTNQTKFQSVINNIARDDLKNNVLDKISKVSLADYTAHVADTKAAYDPTYTAWKDSFKAEIQKIADYMNKCVASADDFKTELEKLPNKQIPNEKDPKCEWYTNLWYRMGSPSDKEKTPVNGLHYVQIDDRFLSNDAWLKYALENGIISMEQVIFNEQGSTTTPALQNREWKSIKYSASADITEQEDKTRISKAEIKYEKSLREIQAKDKQYDQDLKKLDTQHNALQTEYESLKSVIDKNVERSFKAFS